MIHSKINNIPKGKPPNRTTAYAAVSSKSTTTLDNKTCPICTKTYHKIYQCQTFMQAIPANRKKLVSKEKLYLNCLWTSHYVGQCSSEQTCKIYGMKYHTLLHLETHQLSNEKPTISVVDSEPQSSNTSKTETPRNVLAHHGIVQAMSMSTILLSTALVYIHGANGQIETCALLDSASESHFISSALVNRLHLKRKNHNFIVSGVSKATSVKEVTLVDISSRTTSKHYKLLALITPKITVDLPTAKVDISEWKYVHNKPLADP